MYTFAYDSYGNATESKIVNASDDDEFIKTVAAYNSTGSLMTSITDPFGNTISYSYDEATGRLTKATDARGNDTSYAYNTKGQVTSLSTAVTNADGQALTAQASYTYTNDYLTGINYHGQIYSFVYDGFGNKTAVKQGNTALVSYTYGANNGNLLTETFANGIGFVYNYDKYDRLISVTYKASQTDSGTLLYSYKYSKDGNLVVLTEALDGREYRYYYDLTDRLVFLKTISEMENPQSQNIIHLVLIIENIKQ